MNRTLLSALLAAGALTAAAPAFAQGWQDIQTRQAATFQRIDDGVRRGVLTASEAFALRNEFISLIGLENQYRPGGLSPAEQADLNRRVDLVLIKARGDDRPTYNGRPWQTIDSRQAMLDQRIDLGVRSGALTRDEAARLRAEFRGIAATEAGYRVDGLSTVEIADLDRRFDTLSAKIRVEANDRQTANNGPNGRPFESINARQAMLDQRIDTGVRVGSLTRQEAASLRREFRDIAGLEARYRVDGLSQIEVADLDRRFDVLNAKIRVQAGDRQQRWEGINERQARLDARIDGGVRNGTLTRQEGRRLQREFRDLAALEARYRVDGLSRSEQGDLDRRFDLLSAQIRFQAADNQGRR